MRKIKLINKYQLFVSYQMHINIYTVHVHHTHIPHSYSVKAADIVYIYTLFRVSKMTGARDFPDYVSRSPLLLS